MNYISQINKKQRLQEKEKDAHPLREVGRIHKFHDYILKSPYGISSISWQLGGPTVCLSNILPAEFYGFGSHTRVGKKVSITRIKFRIMIYPVVILEPIVGSLDNLRTIVFYDSAPRDPFDAEGAYTVLPRELLKNFDINQGDYGTEAFSDYNVENSNRFKILFDDKRELVVPANGNILNWVIDFTLDRRKTASHIEGDLKDLDLICEYDDSQPVGRQSTTGAVYIMTMGNYTYANYTGTLYCRTFFDDELDQKDPKYEPYIQYY